MKPVIKFILKNTLEKKFRTFLIIFSIMMGTALFFSSITVSDTMVQMFEKQTKNEFGSADIVIMPKEQTPDPFFDLDITGASSGDFDYTIGAIRGAGTYEDQEQETWNVSLLGIQFDDLQKLNPITITDGDAKSLSGNQIVVSRTTADKHNLQVGSTLDLQVYGEDQSFSVAAIAAAEGPFIEPGKSMFLIVPREKLEAIYDRSGQVNMAYLKLNDPLQKDAVIDTLSNKYDDYYVNEPVANEMAAQQVKPMSMSFLLVSIIVLLISAFIINSSFKVMTRERLPVIGTLRSIGATKWKTNSIFLLESLLYGLVGGVLGCGMGIGLLYGMTMGFFAPMGGNVPPTLNFSALQLIGAFLMALFTAFASAYFPIIKATKSSIRDVIFNTVEYKADTSVLKTVLGLALLAMSIFLPLIAPKSVAVPLDVLSMVGALGALILLIPAVISISLLLLEKVCELFFGNTGVIAAKNLKNNKIVLRNITLLVIGISSLLMINTVSSSVVGTLTSIFSNTIKHEVSLATNDSTQKVLDDARTVEGVEGAYGDYLRLNQFVDEFSQPITVLQGIDTEHYLDYWNMTIEGDQEQVLNTLHDGRSILVTTTLRDRYDLDIGKSITLDTENGKQTYKVGGYFQTFSSLGNYALISAANFEKDMKASKFTSIVLKTSSDPEQLGKRLKDKFSKIEPAVTYMKDIEETERLTYGGILAGLQGFTLIVFLIGLLGIFNNLVISFIERKRSLAIYRSIGMSSSTNAKILTLEAILSGLLGGVVGIIGGLLMINSVSHLLRDVNAPITMTYSVGLFLSAIVVGIVVYYLASLQSIRKSAKLNIIQTIKFE